MIITHSVSEHENVSSATSLYVNSTGDVEQKQKVDKSHSFTFKDFKKRSKESLSFKKRKRNKEPMSIDSTLLSVNHPYSTGTSSPVSPKAPTSPGGLQCRCRRCSLLPLEECEPKEVSALFKFLRKSKVIIIL